MTRLSGAETVSVIGVGLLAAVILWAMTIWVVTPPGEVTDVPYDTMTTSTVGTTVTPHQVDIHTSNYCTPR